MTNPRQRNLLELIDVLVDGPFIKSQRDETLRFRGSRNQRLIDVKASLRHNRLTLWSDSR
jgi:anaerobic ribonucleoside-triphosphate reductase activating protein